MLLSFLSKFEESELNADQKHVFHVNIYICDVKHDKKEKWLEYTSTVVFSIYFVLWVPGSFYSNYYHQYYSINSNNSIVYINIKIRRQAEEERVLLFCISKIDRVA